MLSINKPVFVAYNTGGNPQGLLKSFSEFYVKMFVHVQLEMSKGPHLVPQQVRHLYDDHVLADHFTHLMTLEYEYRNVIMPTNPKEWPARVWQFIKVISTDISLVYGGVVRYDVSGWYILDNPGPAVPDDFTKENPYTLGS